jgi:hypothetical protein
MGLVRAGALALLLALVVAVSPAAAQTPDDPAKAAQAVLDVRVNALRDGDRGAWLSTLDPQAPGAFKEAQGRLFDGLRQVPLESYSLEVRTRDTGDLGGRFRARYGGARTFLPETRQRHRIRGYDDRDAADSLWLTFVERDGRWYIGGDTDLSPLGLDTTRGLWDFGPVQVLPGEHIVVLHHPAQAERARALLDVTEEAVRVLSGRWDLPWSQKIPLILPGSVDELEEILQSTIDLDKFVAFVAYSPVRDEGYDVTAPRIYIQDRNLGRYNRQFQVETLVHELAHAAAVPHAGPHIPIWVHEGLADWVATGRATNERRPGGSDGRLPRDYEFTTGSQESIVRAYGEARSAISRLAGAKGVGTPTALLKAAGEPRSAPGNADHHIDAALRGTAGLGFADLETLWGQGAGGR